MLYMLFLCLNLVLSIGYNVQCRQNLTFATILIVNTVDGSFVGIDISNGKKLWEIPGTPLISQSLSELRLITATHDYSLVPSLDGQLYLLERNSIATGRTGSLKALPLTVESLFASNFMLTEDSILTGGKDSSLFAFDPLTGKLRYNCSRDGCSGHTSNADSKSKESLDPGILVYRNTHVVRAVHVPTGSEKWNLSIQNNELCVIHGRLSTSTTSVRQNPQTCDARRSSTSEDIPSSDAHTGTDSPTIAAAEDVHIEFDLDRLMIIGRTNSPVPDDHWHYFLPERIAKSWIYNTQAKTLDPIRLFSMEAEKFQSSPYTDNCCRDNSANLLMEKLNPGQVNIQVPPKLANRKTTLSNYFTQKTGQRFGRATTRRPSLECPSRDRLVYLGTLNGQLYVQLEDGFDSPSPTYIDLPKVSVVPPKPSESPPPSVDHTPSAEAMVGYYRASYSTHPTDDVCHQPFLTDEASEQEGRKQTGLVPWFPREQADAFSRWTASRSEDRNSPNTDEETQTDPDELFSDWLLSGANDLLMLLLRANEISDRNSRETTIFILPSSLYRFSHLLQLGLLILLIRITDRIFQTFHGPAVASSTSTPDHSSTPLSIGGVHCLPCPNCSASSTASCSLHNNSNSQSSSSTLGSAGTQSVVSPHFTSVYENEFIFIRCLGRGGFGRVFEAENRFDGCRYAIKRIQIDEKREDKNKFLREVKALASLDHPGIVRYHRAWSETPPPGWQEARDQVLFGQAEDTGADVDSMAYSSKPSVKWNSDSSFTQDPSSTQCSDAVAGFHHNKESSNGLDLSMGSFVSSPHLNDDSLIVFARPDDQEVTEAQTSTHTSVTQSVDPVSVDPRVRSLTTSYEVTYLYIQMQLCSPLSLRNWLLTHNRQESRPPRTELYHMFRQITDAVAYLHEHRLMHRDLKPSNILFDLTNRLKLADFGLVTSMFDEEVRQRVPSGGDESVGAELPSTGNAAIESLSNGGDSGHVDSAGSHKVGHSLYRYAQRHTNNVGTDLYMSPEQERGDPYDYKVDIFSLGLIFTELLIPFETNMERIHTLTQAKLGRLPSQFSQKHAAESAFLLQLLDSMPSHRPSASQILNSPLLAPSPMSTSQS